MYPAAAPGWHLAPPPCAALADSAYGRATPPSLLLALTPPAPQRLERLPPCSALSAPAQSGGAAALPPLALSSSRACPIPNLPPLRRPPSPPLSELSAATCSPLPTWVPLPRVPTPPTRPVSETRKECGWCRTVNTSQWRVGPKGGSIEMETLCNACGINYRRALNKTDGRLDLDELANAIGPVRPSIQKSLKRLRLAPKRARAPSKLPLSPHRVIYDTPTPPATPLPHPISYPQMSLPPIQTLLRKVDSRPARVGVFPRDWPLYRR